MRYFVFADIHGEYDVLIKKLQKQGFNENNPNHILIGLGDNFDRGKQSLELYTFLSILENDGKFISILGNHDKFFLDFLLEKSDGVFNCQYNGMMETLRSFIPNKPYFSLEEYRYEIKKRYPHLIEFLTSMPYGIKIGNYVLTHAGFEYNTTFQNWYINDWADTKAFIATCKNYNNLKFVFGHYHASILDRVFNKKDNPNDYTFKYKNFIGLDSCSNLTKRVNIIIIESNYGMSILNNKITLKNIEKIK